MGSKNLIYQYSLSYKKRAKYTLVILAVFLFITYLDYLSKDYEVAGYLTPIILFLVSSLLYNGEWAVEIDKRGIKVTYFTGRIANINWEEIVAYQINKPRITWEMTYVYIKKKDEEIKTFPIRVEDEEKIASIFSSHGIKKNINFEKSKGDTDLGI